MSTVVVNDASCPIDLHKGRLLAAMLTLPHRFVVPLSIRHAEALHSAAPHGAGLATSGTRWARPLRPTARAGCGSGHRQGPPSEALSEPTASVWSRRVAMIAASCSPETGYCVG